MTSRVLSADPEPPGSLPGRAGSTRGRLGPRTACWLLAAVSLGCEARPAADLHQLYDRTVRAASPERNPVVLIPGISGSRLVEAGSGRVAWGGFFGRGLDPDTPEGMRLLALPMRQGAALEELRDEVLPAGVLDRIQVEFLGLPLELEAYARILSVLGAGGYRDESLGLSGAVDYPEDHFTCFQFAWDWRLDLPANAARLEQFLDEKAEAVRRERDLRSPGAAAAPVEFDVVAHSMGGLLLRWYQAFGAAALPPDGSLPSPSRAGAGRIGRAILVGPPNAGSLEALGSLLHGADLGTFLPRLEPGLIGTWPSVYQLLPRRRHGAVLGDTHGPPAALDLLDPALWEEHGWGLLDARQDPVLARLLPDIRTPELRREVARDHLRKCLARAAVVQAALDDPRLQPAGPGLDLIAGDATPTASVSRLDSATGELLAIEWAPGDGTVTRASALLDERAAGGWQARLVSPIAWRRVLFLPEEHFRLTRDPAFADNVLFTLLEEPRSATSPP